MITSRDALTMIGVFSNEAVLKELNDRGLRVDWKALFRDLGAEGVIEDKPKVGVPPSRFDIDKAAPVLRDAPKSLAAVRDDLNQLIKEVAEDRGTLVGKTALNRVLGIIEQIIMTLENVAVATTQLSTRQYAKTLPPVYPTVYPPITIPAQTPFSPYYGDPMPFPGSGTTCGATDVRAINQADGHADDSHGSPYKPLVMMTSHSRRHS